MKLNCRTVYRATGHPALAKRYLLKRWEVMSLAFRATFNELDCGGLNVEAIALIRVTPELREENDT